MMLISSRVYAPAGVRPLTEACGCVITMLARPCGNQSGRTTEKRTAPSADLCRKLNRTGLPEGPVPLPLCRAATARNASSAAARRLSLSSNTARMTSRSTPWNFCLRMLTSSSLSMPRPPRSQDWATCRRCRSR